MALVDSGEADVHAVDHDGNTPLHLAAKANKARTVHQLANIEEHQIREVLSGRLHPGMDREVPLMFSGAESASRGAAAPSRHLHESSPGEQVVACASSRPFGPSRGTAMLRA